jgi:hypothetical protein
VETRTAPSTARSRVDHDLWEETNCPLGPYAARSATPLLPLCSPGSWINESMMRVSALSHDSVTITKPSLYKPNAPIYSISALKLEERS